MFFTYSPYLYFYDENSRLIREDNKKLDKTFFYEYDRGGNIVRKTSYKYNLNNREAITSTATTYNYEYPTTGWKDQMLSFNGLACEYDELGNPTTYKGKTLTWDNLRTLKTYDNASFTYDKNGIRTSKTITTTETDDEGVETTTVVTKKFYLDGNKIIMQDNGDADTNSGISTKLFFHYGADGVTGFTYRKNKTTFVDYFYKKNAQGDIIGIYDHTGKEVARYYYDAWGNCDAYYFISTSMFKLTSTTTSSYAVPAQINPFRYRGYYYDTETNLYYLNSRYYDPETGRFINADDISVLDATKSIINGLNLYAYCLNNPVNETDESGYLIFSLFLAFLIGGTIAASANILSQVIFENKTLTEIQWGKVGITFLSAGISSLIPGGNFLSILGQSLTFTFIDSGLNSLFYNEKVNPSELIMNVFLQMITSYTLKGISILTSKLTSKIFIKGLNYSQYQHYFRKLGYDYTKTQVYEKMFKHYKLKSITMKTVEYFADFIIEFFTSGLSFGG